VTIGRQLGTEQYTYPDITSAKLALETKTEFDFSAIILKRSWCGFECARRWGLQDNIKGGVEALPEAENYIWSKQRESIPLLWLQCFKQLQHKIQNNQDHLSIKNDPFKLCTDIWRKQTWCALKNLINIKHKEDESLIDYKARFESVQDIAVAAAHLVLEYKNISWDWSWSMSMSAQRRVWVSKNVKCWRWVKNGISSLFKNYLKTDFWVILLNTATPFTFSTLIHYLG